MLTRLYYETKILMHRAKWYYIEFFRVIVGLLATLLVLTATISLFKLLG